MADESIVVKTYSGTKKSYGEPMMRPQIENIKIGNKPATRDQGILIQCAIGLRAFSKRIVDELIHKKGIVCCESVQNSKGEPWIDKVIADGNDGLIYVEDAQQHPISY